MKHVAFCCIYLFSSYCFGLDNPFESIKNHDKNTIISYCISKVWDPKDPHLAELIKATITQLDLDVDNYILASKNIGLTKDIFRIISNLYQNGEVISSELINDIVFLQKKIKVCDEINFSKNEKFKNHIAKFGIVDGHHEDSIIVTQDPYSEIDKDLLTYPLKNTKKNFDEIFAGQVPALALVFKEILKDKSNVIFDYVKDYSLGLLLYGPTGTGKTTLIRALASERPDYFYFELDGSKISDKYFGESERKLREVFDQVYNIAKENNTKSILFIDEIDSLLSGEGSESSNTKDKNQKICAIFKTYFGGSNSDAKAQDFANRVIIMGATNYIESIPLPVARRFPQKILMPNPDFDQRLSVINYHLAKVPNQSLLDIQQDDLQQFVQYELEGANCGEITNIVITAGLQAYLVRSKITIDILRESKELVMNNQNEENDNYKNMFM